MTLTVGSLFSGIGGLDLGLERAGMKVIWQSEIDGYASKVLKKHWPEVPNYGDIKAINWRNVERPNVICGGYPCQPFSTAGNRRGTDDPRHLWPWVKQAISELRPDYAIMENVRGHLSMGLTDVLGDLADIGFHAWWRVISASSIGANHQRERVFIVAYPSSEPGYGVKNNSRDSAQPETVPQFRNNGGAPALADTYGLRLERPRAEQQTARITGVSKTVAYPKEFGGDDRGTTNSSSEITKWLAIQSQTRGSSSIDYAGWWETEPDVGRVANGVSSRVDRLKCLGNAVVPQVAEYVGRLVMEHANA